MDRDVPAHLTDYADRFEDDPRAASREWFEDAKYGLFLHYGLYSILGDGEWVQFWGEISPDEYGLLSEYFTADRFDAESIVELAQDAGMSYVTMTAKHHDGFCLYDTDETGFNSVDTAAGRDLIGELAEACHDAGLGFFAYYSVGVDWRHPHAPNREDWGFPARPDYDDRPKIYADAGHELDNYLAFAEAQIRELLEYDPAGIWLDPSVFETQMDEDGWDPEPFDLPSLYETIRSEAPGTLISFKNGVTGTEDFVAPELYYEKQGDGTDKPGEVCACMIPGEAYEDDVDYSWGYSKEADGKHKTVEEVWELLGDVRSAGHNLLLNTGPLPDGSIHEGEAEVLREVGDRIEEEGFPGE